MSEQKISEAGRRHERIALRDVVPLPNPLIVKISPADLCNFRCVYCNHSVTQMKGARILPLKDFMHIVDSIKVSLKEKKLKSLILTGNGEPLLNKQLPQMINYAHEVEISDRIEFSSNGLLFTPQLIDSLLDGEGITRINISVQGIDSESYQRVTNRNVDFEKFVDTLRYLYSAKGDCEIIISTLEMLIDGCTEKFYEIFQPISDSIRVGKVYEAFEEVDYSQFNQKFMSQSSSQKIRVCPNLFYRANIHSFGDVETCCGSSIAVCIGNIFQSEFADIWNSKRHRGFMKLHLQGKKDDIDACKKCQYLGYYDLLPEDNLDDYCSEILSRLETQFGKFS